MDLPQLLQRIDRDWRPLLAAIVDLPDTLVMEPRTLDRWSVADMLGHVATWEEEAIVTVDHLLVGERPPQRGWIPAYNAREVERKRHLSAAQMRRHVVEAHERLLAFIRGLPPEAYARDGPVRRTLRVGTTSHYREHTAQLLAWRRARRLREGK